MKRLIMSLRRLVVGGALAASVLLTTSASAQELWSRDTHQVTILRAYRSGWVLFNAGATRTLTYSCPANASPTGGGFEARFTEAGRQGMAVLANYPLSNRQWRVILRNLDNTTQDVRIYIVCAE